MVPTVKDQPANELKVSRVVDIGPIIKIDQRSGEHSKDGRTPMVVKGIKQEKQKLVDKG